jgi:hypothetical protein
MRQNIIMLACACLVSQVGCIDRQPVERRTADVEISGEAAEATDRDAAKESEELKAETKRKLDELDLSIEKLKARAHELKEEARPEWERQMARLEEARQRARQELAELSSSTREAWQDAKPSLEAAWENVRQAYDDAARHFDSTPEDKPDRNPM